MSSRRTRAKGKQTQDGSEAETPKDPVPKEAIASGVRRSKRKLAEAELLDPADAKTEASQIVKKRKKSRDEVTGLNSSASASTAGTSQGIVSVSSASKIMQNNLVLDLIAKKLPGEELFKLRETCTLWNQCFVPDIKKTCDRPINLYNARDTYWGENAMSDYTTLMQSSKDIPFTLYTIFDSTEARLRDFKDFFSVCGKSVRHLLLDSHSAWEKGVNMDRIRQMIFELTPELTTLTLRTDSDEAVPVWNKRQKKKFTKIIPNLQRLNLGTLGDIPAAYVELFNDILKHAIGLTSLSMEEGHNDSNLEIISSVRDSMPHIEKLKCLQLYELRAPELRILVELARRKQNPLRLQELRTSILYRTDDHDEVSNQFHTFLTTQAGSLQKFDIELDGFTFDGNGAERKSIQIPKMNALQSFAVRRHGVKEFILQYGEGTLASNFPQLKRFSYNFFNYGFWNSRTDSAIVAHDMSVVQHAELTDLALDVAFDKKTLVKFGILLPAVTHLQLELMSSNMNLLAAVFTMWPRLVSLELRYKQDSYRSLDLDELLSGIPKPKHKAVSRQLGQLGSTPPTLERIRTISRKFKTKPGLSDLQQLKRFKIYLGEYAYKITDFGGYFGFAMASSEMQHMVIESSLRRFVNKNNGVSDPCRELIKSAFGPYTVIKIKA